MFVLFWEGGGLKIVLVVDFFIYFVNIRFDYKVSDMSRCEEEKKGSYFLWNNFVIFYSILFVFRIYLWLFCFRN